MDVNYLKVGFTTDMADADVSDSRATARRIAGQTIRAIAMTLQRPDPPDHITIRLHASPTDNAITGASLTRLAQQLDPLPQPPLGKARQ